MTETEGAGDEELFSTLFPPGRPFLIGGPAIRVRREGGGWVRPHPGHLGRFPHRSTSARIVCSWTKNRPTLVAVVACRHKRAAPGLHGRSECANGQDLLAACQCGWDHVIDGRRLQSYLTKTANSRFIGIMEVSRDKK